jgi:hypothetical protein
VNTAVVVAVNGNGFEAEAQAQEVDPPVELKVAEERVNGFPLSVMVLQPELEIGLAAKRKYK